MSVKLKIKQKSLAAESVVIKQAQYKMINHDRKRAKTRKATNRHNRLLYKSYDAYVARMGLKNDVVSFEDYANSRGGIQFVDSLEDFMDTKKFNFGEYESLQHHRKNVVGLNSRAVHLARGFLNDRTYRDVEAAQSLTNLSKSDKVGMMSTKQYSYDALVSKVAAMLAKYGNIHGTDTVQLWLEADARGGDGE